MQLSNQQIAKLFREIAAAYTIKKSGNIFEIRAYENAADSIEQSTSDLHDLWKEGNLNEIPGLGKKLQSYLDEQFSTGRVKHFEALKAGIPKVLFDLLDVPGVGPKTAQELVRLEVKNLEDLKKKIKSGQLVSKGFSAKIAQKIMQGLAEIAGRQGRMLLPYAFAKAEGIVQYLKKSKDVLEIHPLGSLRRMVATVGDLDFAVSCDNPSKVVDYFCKMQGVARIIEQGEYKATVTLQSGMQADLLVGKPSSFGALLQHFTGSKAHNIHLRILAEKKGLSLSEYGVRAKSNKLLSSKTEEEFYKLLGMDTPAPEIREDAGEIEAALAHKLPDLVEIRYIKGDLHLHSNYPIKNPSHGPGIDSIEEIIDKAESLGYEFVGISDHPPGHGVVSKSEIISWVEKRTKFIQKMNMSKKSIRVLNGLEVDILPDGTLSVPDKALEMLDYCIAGIHSGHRGSKDVMTKRLMAALQNPNVDIISHPTNRLLNERESSQANWEEIFQVAAENKKLLEINGHPIRLDLRDDLVRMAKKLGVKFVIDSDAHEISQMDNMIFGVSVARRGWAEKKDIANSWDWTDFAKWFKLGL